LKGLLSNEKETFEASRREILQWSLWKLLHREAGLLLYSEDSQERRAGVIAIVEWFEGQKDVVSAGFDRQLAKSG